MNRKLKLIITSAAVVAAGMAGAVGAAANTDDEPAEPGKAAITADDDRGDNDDKSDKEESGDRDDAPEDSTAISGPNLQRAKKAALAHLGGGKVTETEIADEESHYELEVRMPSGREVDVHLDKSFTVVDVPDD